MSKDSIFVDTKQLNKIGIELKGFEKQMPGAVSSALNRTISHINTKVGKIVSTEYVVNQKDVKDALKRKKLAKKGELSASLMYVGSTLSLAHFQFTPKAPQGKKKYKVKVKIKRQEGKKVVSTDPRAFIATTGALTEEKTQYNVFRRIGDKRLPITVIRTLSIPQMIGNGKVEVEVQEIANKKLNERIEHEINWRLDKIKKKIED